MSKRGKSRPRKLGDTVHKTKPLIVRPCSTCFHIKPTDDWAKVTDECRECFETRLRRRDPDAEWF